MGSTEGGGRVGKEPLACSVAGLEMSLGSKKRGKVCS